MISISSHLLDMRMPEVVNPLCINLPQYYTVWYKLIWLEVSYLFQQISIDFIMDLSILKEYDLILVVVDHGLTKVALFISCHKTCTSEDMA